MAQRWRAPDAVVAKLQKQLEYYFSDANLRRDAHLKGLAGADNDRRCGWVDLEHVLAFSRARAILDELPSTTDGEPATKRAKIPAVALDAARASAA